MPNPDPYHGNDSWREAVERGQEEGRFRKLFEASQEENKRLYEAGKYMAAALRFYAMEPDRYYSDAKAAVEHWERVTEENNYA